MTNIKQGNSFDAVFTSAMTFIKSNWILVAILGAIIGSMSAGIGIIVPQYLENSQIVQELETLEVLENIEVESIQDVIAVFQSPEVVSAAQNIWSQYGIYVILLALLFLIIYTCIEIIYGYAYFESENIHTASSIGNKITASIKQCLPYIGTNLLYGIMLTAIGAILVGPAIWSTISAGSTGGNLGILAIMMIITVCILTIITVYMQFIKYIMIKDDIYFLDAYQRSYEIVKNRRRETLGYGFIIGILLSVISLMVGGIIATIGTYTLQASASSLITMQAVSSILNSILSFFLIPVVFAFFLRRDQTVITSGDAVEKT